MFAKGKRFLSIVHFAYKSLLDNAAFIMSTYNFKNEKSLS